MAVDAGPMTSRDKDTLSLLDSKPGSNWMQLKPGFGSLQSCEITEFVRLPHIGSRTVYKIHDNNFHNLVRGLLTRVFSVKYTQEIQDNYERRVKALVAKNSKAFEVARLLQDYTDVDLVSTLLGGLVGDRVVKGERGPPLPPLTGSFNTKGFAEFRQRVLRHMPMSTPIDRELFPEYYEGPKKAMYQRAVESLYAKPVCEADSRIKVFTKKEKINFTDKDDPDPRVIQPRSPRYNVEVGRFLKQMEPRLCKAVGKVWGGPVISKGLNARQTAELIHEKWGKFATPIGLGLDASRFDQHVSVEALKYEHGFYTAKTNVRHRKKLEKLLSWQLNNGGAGYCKDGKLKYHVEGKRMSGDMNTGLGNCLLMCAMIYAYAQERNVKCDLINNGDDCVVFMERRDLERFKRDLSFWFSLRGFTMTVEEPVHNIEQVQFCQANPVFSNGYWIMARDPKAALSKDACCLIPKQANLGEWMVAVGQCGMALAGHLPIYSSYYRAYIREGEKWLLVNPVKNKRSSGHKRAHKDVNLNPHMQTGMAKLSEGLQYTGGKVDDDGRFAFHAAFGIHVDIQKAYEEYYDRWNMDLSIQEIPELGSDLRHAAKICSMGLLS